MTRGLIAKYMQWLRSGFHFKVATMERPVAVIVTPFLDCHNDEIEIYIERADGGFLLGGAGTVNFLKPPPRLAEITRRFDVKHVAGVLCSATTKKDFPVKMQNLIQAILAVNEAQQGK